MIITIKRTDMKNFHFKSILVLICLFHVLLSCNRVEKIVSIDADKQQVEQAINNSIGWAKTKDIQLLYSVIANDTNYLEIDPDNKVVKGFREFKKAETFWMNPDFKAIRYEIKNLKINFSKSGDVAWFFCMLNDINEWKGQPANWENTRWTGVLEKRNKHWIIVQMHFSFASD
jgi:hypothetical protein